MNKTIKLPQLLETASKADEIAYLDDIMAAVDPKTYLGTFLYGASQWLRIQIEMDLYTNLYEVMIFHRTSLETAMTEALATEKALRAELERVTSDLDNERKKVRSLTESNDRLNDNLRTGAAF